MPQPPPFSFAADVWHYESNGLKRLKYYLEL
jgi:hypothetical protein